MADKILRLKIDVSKIDKNRLFKGEKGTYLDCTLLYNEATDQYGNNGMITQDVSKEDREAGQKGTILGNAKEFVQSGRSQQTPPPSSPPLSTPQDDDLPF